MAQDGTAAPSDLVQTATPSQKIRDLAESLGGSIKADAIAEKHGCSKVECSYDETILKEVWTEFIEEFKKIRDIINAIVPDGNSLSTGVRLLVFQAGWSRFYDLVDKEDCIVLIPVVISGSAEVTLQDDTTKRQTEITLKTKSESLISGRCAIEVRPQSKFVCIVLCIGKNKGKGKV